MKRSLFLLFCLLPFFIKTYCFVTTDNIPTKVSMTHLAGITGESTSHVPFNHTRPQPSGTKLQPDDTRGASFYEDFRDRLETHWTGHTGGFGAVDERLRINETAISPASIAVTSRRMANTVWEMGVQVDGLLTSGNYIRIYLSSNTEDFSQPHQGYHLQIDGSRGNHSYRLWRQNGSARTTIFQSDPIPNQQGKFRARVRVVRDIDGNWQILADEYDNGIFETVHRNNGEATAYDNTHSLSGYAGYFANFSYTRRSDFKLDYFLIKIFDPIVEPMPDRISPSIQAIHIRNDVEIALIFNKPPDPASTQIQANYVLNPGNQYPTTIEATGKIVVLTFLTPFTTEDNMLTISGIRNSDGFVMEADTAILFHYQEPSLAQPYDIIINEIMANPNGNTGLPHEEYVELYNRTDRPIPLAGWRYGRENSSHTFTHGQIPPRGYLILCHTKDEASFSSLGSTQGITPWPTLVNAGTTLKLVSDRGTTIDSVAYSNQWYRDNSKRNGGWSLERIAPHDFCLDADNWKASLDNRGGTPGIQNSVIDENHNAELGISSLDITNPQEIIVVFSRNIDTLRVREVTLYGLNHGFGNPQSITIGTPRALHLHFAQPFETGTEYTLSIQQISDCSGSAFDVTHSFFLPDTIGTGDILINEILFNPKTDGVDFVEIYNHSNKILDLQTLDLANVNTATGLTANRRKVSEAQLRFYPGEYRVLTTQPDIVKQHYPNAYFHTFIQMPSLPTFNNASGSAVLISRDVIIDSLSYHENMHSELFSNKKGVSLERQDFDKPTVAPGNFRSAATSVGGATPGYQNSQATILTNHAGISLASKTFSPDSDGFEDLLEIHYQFPQGGNMANIDIYNNKGQLVRKLQRNQSWGTKGVITWDGLTDTNQRLPVGIYTALIEVYNTQGLRKIYRESFVLAAKL